MASPEQPADVCPERRGGRPAAGTDPRKRQQILEGAGRVFSTLGFDAASMNDVAREARVSKATLYVYYEDKEHLFAAICAETRDRNISDLIARLDVSKPLAETLQTFGETMLRRLSDPAVIAAHRIVIGVAERMPDVGREFYEAGPRRLRLALVAYLDHHVQAGALRIEDRYLAAAQFLELAQALVFRRLLFGVNGSPPSDDEIVRVVASAVSVFLAAYGTRVPGERQTEASAAS